MARLRPQNTARSYCPRILFIVTNIGVVESYGPMYLSSIARKDGHETRFARFLPKNVKKMVQEWRPDIIAWSAFSGEFNKMAELNDLLKKDFSFASIFGGPHVTFFPESLQGHSIDYGVVGEGEGAFKDLIDLLRNQEAPGDIANIVTPTKHECSIRFLITDLDSLPMPDYDGYYETDKWLREFPVKMFMPSRGCPFNCAYCFNHQYNRLYWGKGRVVRRYSVDRTLDEILYVRKRFPVELVRFNDDCFVLKRDAWLEEFCTRYPKTIGLPFFCVINPNVVTEDIMKLLREAGCTSVFMSIECGNEAYREEVMGRTMANEKLIHAFEIVRRQKLHILSGNILALPGTSFETDLETLRMNQKCRPACCVGSIFSPYPKLRLTEYAIRNGYYSPDRNSLGLPATFFGKSVLNFPEYVKTKQKNLSDIFCLLVKFPFLEKILLRLISRTWLIKPLGVVNSCFTGYLYQRKIYPHRITPKRIFYNIKAATKYFSQIILND